MQFVTSKKQLLMNSWLRSSCLRKHSLQRNKEKRYLITKSDYGAAAPGHEIRGLSVQARCGTAVSVHFLLVTIRSAVGFRASCSDTLRQDSSFAASYLQQHRQRRTPTNFMTKNSFL